MSVKTIYTCDKCKAEQTSNDQFWVVGIKAHTVDYKNDSFVPGKQMEVCRPCLELLGIHAMKKEGVVTPAPPTIEDLIVEIIRNNTEQP